MNKLPKISYHVSRNLNAFHLTQLLQIYKQCNHALLLHRITAKQSESKLKAYLDERLYSNDKSAYALIKRRKRIAFDNAPVIKATGENLKVKQVKMESKALASVVNVVNANGLMFHSKNNETPSYRGVSTTIQCQKYIQEDPQK